MNKTIRFLVFTGMKRKILLWELIGIVAIFLLSSLFHFGFAWSGNNPALAFVFATNESTWEHMKIFFWATLLFGLVEFAIGIRAPNFIAAKGLAVFLVPFLIPLLFYGYLAILGKDSLLMDLLIGLLAVAAGQGVSLALLRKQPLPKSFAWFGFLFGLSLIVLFVVFSYVPPHNFLFQDPRNGMFGIP
jgi:hypothetical protein